MNFAQWAMVLQFVTCLFTSIGFAWIGKPWTGAVWGLYSTANICWFMIASGRQ